MKSYDEYSDEEREIIYSIIKKKNTLRTKEERKLIKEFRAAREIHSNEETIRLEKEYQQWMAEQNEKQKVYMEGIIKALKEL